MSVKTFEVFKNTDGSLRAVKVGFSWPAFFFSWIWALGARLWDIAVSIFVVAAGLRLLEKLVERLPESGLQLTLAFAYFILYIVMLIYIGKNGNRWLKRKLLADGYEVIGTVEALAKDGALAKFKEA